MFNFESFSRTWTVPAALCVALGMWSCGDSGGPGGSGDLIGGAAGEGGSSAAGEAGEGAEATPGGGGGESSLVGGAMQGGATGMSEAGVGGEATLGGAAGGPSGDATGPELIAAALEADLLSEEQALIYEVYSVFGDARLPASYRGNNANLLESDVLTRVWQGFEGLSLEAQEILTPFLQRPSEPGSWANAPEPAERTPPGPPRAAISGFCRQAYHVFWKSVTLPAAHVQVWYDSSIAGQDAAAQELFEAVENYAWPKLIGASGLGLRAPPSDADPDTGVDCAGQDARLDIYLTDLNVWGLTDARNAWDSATDCHGPLASVIQVDRKKSAKQRVATVVHELMHAIQFGYKAKACQEDYGFLRDGTANWAIDHVLTRTPLDQQQEHEWSDCFTTSPEKHLDDRSSGSCVKQGGSTHRDYGSYLFFQYLSKAASPALVKAIVEGIELHPSALEAIDATWKLRDKWIDFSRALLNDEMVTPLKPSFDTWDALKDVTTLRFEATVQNVTHARQNFEPAINNLATKYYRVHFPDVSARSLLFRNGFFSAYKQGKAIKIHALYKNSAGVWQDEDWTPYEQVGLCRDRLAMRTDDLIIIVSNGEWQSGGLGVLMTEDPFYLELSNAGCWKYTGTISCTMIGAVSGGDPTTVTSNLTFKQDPRIDSAVPPTHNQVPDSLRAGVQFVMPLETSGSFTVAASRSSGTCPFTFQQTTTISGTESGVLQINAFPGMKLLGTAGDLLNLVARPSEFFRVSAGSLKQFTAQPMGASCDPEPIIVPPFISSQDLATDVVGANGEVAPASSAIPCTGTLSPQLE